MRATEFIIENADQAAVIALQKKHGWSMGRTSDGNLYFTWQGRTYVFYGERMRITLSNDYDNSVSVVWGMKPNWQGRGNDELSFAQAVQQKLLKFDLSIWQQLDRRQITDSQALQKFKIENERQAREAIAQGATESISEQTNPKISDDISRRGFALGGLGAATVGGMIGNYNSQDKQADTTQPEPAQHANTIATLSNNPQEETLMQKTARAAGIVGTELAQLMGQTKHESWDFSRLKEKGMGKDYFSRKYDPVYAPRTAKILGNKHPGDGEKYHGRGFIQLTGRDNYRMAQTALNIPLLQQPELAEQPDIAAKIAVWYWQTRVKPSINNFNDTKAVTRKINPAGKGLEDRHANFVGYKNILL